MGYGERFARAVLGDAAVDLIARARRIRAARRAAPFVPSEATASAEHRIDGTIAADGAPDRAPFSLSPCIFWVARLEEKVRVEDARHGERIEWRTTLATASSRPFWLVGADGARVLVEPEGAVVDLPLTLLSSEHPHTNDENPTLSTFLRSQGVVPTAFMGIAGEHRFYEATVRSGEPLAVYGHLDEVARHLPHGYRDGTELQKRLRGNERGSLVILAASQSRRVP